MCQERRLGHQDVRYAHKMSRYEIFKIDIEGRNIIGVGLVTLRGYRIPYKWWRGIICPRKFRTWSQGKVGFHSNRRAHVLFIEVGVEVDIFFKSRTIQKITKGKCISNVVRYFVGYLRHSARLLCNRDEAVEMTWDDEIVLWYYRINILLVIWAKAKWVAIYTKGEVRPLDDLGAVRLDRISGGKRMNFKESESWDL